MVEYDEHLARLTERGYLMPEIAFQRSRTMTALNLQAGQHVLDVGCGMGLMTQDLALAVGTSGRVIGVDNSEPMLKLARKRCHDLPQVKLRAGSVDKLADEDNSYDAAVCAQLLLYLDDVPEVLSELHRVLKPGGRIAVVETDWRHVLFNTHDDQFTQRLFADWEASVPSPHLPMQLRKLLLESGFAAVSVEAIPIINTCYLADNYSTGMVEYMLRSQLEAGSITQAKADAYVADLQMRSENNDYFFCINRFLFSAIKM